MDAALSKKEPQIPEKQPHIIQIQSSVLPGVTGGFNLLIYGLGEDGKLYVYNGQKHLWATA